MDWVEDAANHRTSFTYDPVTDRKTAQTDALTKTTRFAFNDRGQVTHTWGDVPYPVSYTYDTYGRMQTMTTFRGTEDFAGENFPASASGDTTTWHYDPATGELTSIDYSDSTRTSSSLTTACGNMGEHGDALNLGEKWGRP